MTGGCFQNKYLTARTVQRLQEEGFRPYWHQRVPPNDGGIALGQVMTAWRTHRCQSERRAVPRFGGAGAPVFAGVNVQKGEE